MQKTKICLFPTLPHPPSTGPYCIKIMPVLIGLRYLQLLERFSREEFSLLLYTKTRATDEIFRLLLKVLSLNLPIAGKTKVRVAVDIRSFHPNFKFERSIGWDFFIYGCPGGIYFRKSLSFYLPYYLTKDVVNKEITPVTIVK